MFGRTHDISNNDYQAVSDGLTRYQRFLAIKGTAKAVQKAIDRLNLTPGVDWRGYYNRITGKNTSGCSKSEMARRYAVGDYFVEGALAKLEAELGTDWDGNENTGLW